MQLASSFPILLANSGSSGAGTLIFIPIMLVAMYFLVFRPQRRRMKEQAALQAAISIGDEVITNAGIYGFVTGDDGDKYWIEIDDDVQIRVAKAAIQRRITPVDQASPDDASSTKSKPDSDSK